MRHKKLVLFVCALLCTAWWTAAQVPSTPAGKQFSAWLSAFNSGEKQKIQDFSQHFKNPASRDIDRDLRFREMTGGFELKKIEESNPTHLAGLVKERNSDQIARFEIEVEEGAPHLITKFSLRAAPPSDSSSRSSARMAESDALTAARQEIDSRSAQKEFSGVVLVAKDGKAILEKAVGLADREHNAPNLTDTKFNLGSMNKMFTAVAIAQLAEAGKLHFDDPIGKYLANYPNSDVAAKVTIHHLLTHTGGTGDIFGLAFQANIEKLKMPADYIALYGDRPLEFEPGSRWEYSNYGFVLLGAIIEKVSGQSYYDYVREHIYTPAGMTSSDSYRKVDNVPNLAIGYLHGENGALEPNAATLPARGSPAGGGYSTAEDLLRFANALVQRKLLNEEYITLVTTGKVAAPGGKYGYGFEDETGPDGVRWFGHNGGSPGVNAEFRIYPDSGYVVAVMSNLDPHAAEKMAEFIGARLPAK